MSSLEALKLLDNALLGDEKSIKYFQLHYDTIITKLINDLEILEILKKSMSVETEIFENDNHEIVKYEYIAFNDWDLDIENREEYNKVKEWLKQK